MQESEIFCSVSEINLHAIPPTKNFNSPNRPEGHT